MESTVYATKDIVRDVLIAAALIAAFLLAGV